MLLEYQNHYQYSVKLADGDGDKVEKVKKLLIKILTYHQEVLEKC